MKTLLKIICITLLVFAPSLVRGENLFVNLTVIIANEGTNDYYGDAIHCPQLIIETDDYYCDGSFRQTKGLATHNFHVTPSGTLNDHDVFGPVTLQAITYGCNGAKGHVRVSIGETKYEWDQVYDSNGSTLDKELTFKVKGETCQVFTECKTNVVLQIYNRDTVTRFYYFLDSSGQYIYPGGVDQSVNAGAFGTFVFSQVDCFKLPISVFMLPKSYLSDDGSVSTNLPPGASTPVTGTNGVYGLDQNEVPSGVVWNGTNGAGSSSNILWSSASNDAAEATKEAAEALKDSIDKGIQQAHDDAGDIKGLLGQINTNLLHGFSITNGFSDSQFALLNSNLTNILQAINDANGITNGATEATLKGLSNLLAASFGSTNGTGTNTGGLSLTNYAQESTLVGISNLLAGSSSTNMTLEEQQAQGETAAQEGKDLLEQIGTTYENDKNARYGSPLSSWKVEVPYLDVGEINLDPFSLDWVVALAAFIRNLVAWICAVSLFYHNITFLISSINSMFAFRQAQTAGGSLFGTNLNPLSCIIVAGVITAFTLVIPMYASNWFGASGLINAITTNPMNHASAAGTVMSCSLYIADQFFPLAFMVWCLIVGVTFRANLMPILWLVGVVIRFLAGL